MKKNILAKCITLFSIILLVACTYTQKITDGPTAFERKQYALAATFFQEDYKKADTKKEQGDIAFLLGESYRKSNQNELALKWYKTAWETSDDLEAMKQYAYALKKAERYQEAKDLFKNLGLEIGSPFEYRKEIIACETATAWKADAEDSRYEIDLLDVNSPAFDYAPTLYQEDKIIFSSDRASSTGDDIYGWTNQAFSDFYVYDSESSTITPFDERLNTIYNEGTISFNGDFTEMVFTRCGTAEGDGYCKLYFTNKENDTWSNPALLDFIEKNTNYTQPTLSKDGKTLYFASDHKDGWGGYDIYSSKKENGIWSYPDLLSRSINTEDDDMFPVLENDTLYFASAGHTGMGGLDIFRAYKIGDEKWSVAQNLKAPINSGADDFGFVVDTRKETLEGIEQMGYFTSSRSSGKGNDDIYYFIKTSPPPPPVVEVDTTPAPPPVIVYENRLEGFVLEKIYQNPSNPNSNVLGRKPLENASVTIQYRDTSYTVITQSDGKFLLVLEEEQDYFFSANKKGYLNNTNRFSSKGIAKDPSQPIQTFSIEIVLDKIFENQEIVLEDIYYDFDKSFIREDAKPSLNNLVDILNRNPSIRIQLSSHTDCRGRNTYNETLSQARAEAAVEYLITQGISNSRLVAKGYGESLPAVTCNCSDCTETEHQLNRRTTFKIIAQ